MNGMDLLVTFWVSVFLCVCLESVKSIYIEGSFVDFIYLKFLFVMACVYFYDAKCNLYTFCTYVHICKYIGMQ